MQSALPQDMVHRVAFSEYPPELLEGQLQLGVNPVRRADSFSQSSPLCDLPPSRTHEDDVPLTADPTTSPILANNDSPSFTRLTSRSLPQNEAIALIEAIFTSKEEVKTISELHGDDAQAFIDTLHTVRFAIFLFGGPLIAFVPGPFLTILLFRL